MGMEAPRIEDRALRAKLAYEAGMDLSRGILAGDTPDVLQRIRDLCGFLQSYRCFTAMQVSNSKRHREAASLGEKVLEAQLEAAVDYIKLVSDSRCQSADDAVKHNVKWLTELNELLKKVGLLRLLPSFERCRRRNRWPHLLHDFDWLQFGREIEGISHEVFCQQQDQKASGAVSPPGIKPSLRGVCLFDAAMAISEHDRMAAKEAKKRWHNSRNPALPDPLGIAQSHALKHLYELNSLLKFIELCEGGTVECRNELQAKLQNVRPGISKPSEPSAK